MALWEYKIITSGKGGFASATMLESYINQLGRDEWEIIEFRTDPTNPLAFNGLARRSTLREWTLEAAVAAAAKAEADKLRAELMQKQHAGDLSASSESPAGDKTSSPEGLRQLRDTDRDHDPEALADEASSTGDDWADLDNYEDDLPVFFDAIKPHLRKNPNAAGQSVALNYLAKRWEQSEADLNGALIECGLIIPEHDTDAPVYLEYEGDLYWVEKNNRGQYFLNTREKPRPKFRVAQGKPLDPSDPVYAALAEEQAEIEAERARRAAEQAAREAEAAARRAEREAQRQAAEQARREQQAAAQAAREAARAAASAGTTPTEPAAVSEPSDQGAETAPSATTPHAPSGFLPEGTALLDAIRPLMRRNRRGPGYSGSAAFLAKHFKVEESALRSALAGLGLIPAPAGGPRSEPVVIGSIAYWVNLDGGGGLWINGRETSQRPTTPSSNSSGHSTPPAAPQHPTETPAAAAAPAEATAPDGAAADAAVFRPIPRAMPPLPAEEATLEKLATTAEAPQPPSEPPGRVTTEPPVEAPSIEPSPTPAPPPAQEVPASAPTTILSLASLREALTPNKGKTGVSASLTGLAEKLGKAEADLLAALLDQGLATPALDDPEAKPVFVEHSGEIFWLSRYAKDGSLWLNAKTARANPRRSASPRPRSRRRSTNETENATSSESSGE